MEKEKGSENDSSTGSQIGTEIFEGSVDRTEDADMKSPQVTATPLAEPKTSDVPEYVFLDLINIPLPYYKPARELDPAPRFSPIPTPEYSLIHTRFSTHTYIY